MKKSILLGGVLVAAMSQATIIETETLWSGNFYNNSSSGSILWKLGQSFTVPMAGDSVFDKAFMSWRTTLGRNFTYHLGAVSGNTVTSILASQNSTLIGTGDWERVEFNPANVALTPGSVYAVWVDMPLNSTTVQVKSFNSDVYAAGRYFTGSSSIPGNFGFFNEDSAFRVELVPVPEPASIAAFALGAIGLVSRRRRR